MPNGQRRRENSEEQTGQNRKQKTKVLLFLRLYCYESLTADSCLLSRENILGGIPPNHLYRIHQQKQYSYRNLYIAYLDCQNGVCQNTCIYSLHRMTIICRLMLSSRRRFGTVFVFLSPQHCESASESLDCSQSAKAPPITRSSRKVYGCWQLLSGNGCGCG